MSSAKICVRIPRVQGVGLEGAGERRVLLFDFHRVQLHGESAVDTVKLAMTVPEAGMR